MSDTDLEFIEESKIVAEDSGAESFLPDAEADETLKMTEDSELAVYEAAEIEDLEFIEDERLDSILESILFASDRPVSLNAIKLVFKGTNIKSDKIKRALDRMAIEMAGAQRGCTLEEVPGGYQLRTKVDNMSFLARTLRARPFRLSGPALEVLAIVAYKQPLIKSEIDEIRGVESGHLLRALMEKNLVTFGEKSELPGKPMQYETTKKFLEIFSLRNLRELPNLSQIDELLPEGIGEDEGQKQTLSQLTDALSEQVTVNSYSQGEEELQKISTELQEITATSDFFEQEKIKQKQKREAERAQDIREAIVVGESVSTRDRNWLTRYDEAQMLGAQFQDPEAPAQEVQTAEAPVAVQDGEDDLFSAESLESNDLADIDGESEPPRA